MKQKKCKSCGEKFTPYNTLQKTCSPRCAIGHVQAEKRREFRKETRRLREKTKTRSEWLREAQQAFNAYIRERDRDLPCISCGKPNDGTHQRHASHYRSVGACSALRFNTYNVHASCMQCNAILSGNLIEYRIRLVRKIGRQKVERLERENGIARYDVEYLKRLKCAYRKKYTLYKKVFRRTA